MRILPRAKPPQPIHMPGTMKGEEMAISKGKEAGRGVGRSYRDARDSTSIDPDRRRPIHPAMPNMPPA